MMTYQTFIRYLLTGNPYELDEWAAGVPVAWVERAWEEVEEIRDKLTDILVHDAGEAVPHLDPEHPIIAVLAKGLNCGQVVRLFVAIRDRSYSDERVWRPLFERAFARCVRFLPDPAVNPYFDYYVQGIGFSGWEDEFWSDDRLRRQVVLHMSFDIDMRGSTWCGEDWMLVLHRYLTNEQVIQLYIDLRECTASPEREWRGIFEESFPGIKRFLPPIRDAGLDCRPTETP